MSEQTTVTIERVETLISNDGKVAVVVPMLAVEPTAYRLLDAQNLVFELVPSGSPFRPQPFAMAESAQGAWQILVDTENLLVVELGQELMSLFDERQLDEGVLQELARLQQIAEEISQKGVDVYDAASRAQLIEQGVITSYDAKVLELVERNVRESELAPLG